VHSEWPTLFVYRPNNNNAYGWNEASFCSDSDFRMMISLLTADAFMNAVLINKVLNFMLCLIHMAHKLILLTQF